MTALATFHLDGLILIAFALLLIVVVEKDHARTPFVVRALFLAAALCAFCLGLRYLAIGLHLNLPRLYWARIGLDASLAAIAAVWLIAPKSLPRLGAMPHFHT